MAEDLLSPPRKGKTLEEVGGEYFDYLVARSFLQRSSDKRWESFVMHDLLHDLAIFLGGEFYFRSEDPGVEAKISIKTRHLSLTKFSDLPENFDVLGTAKFLRTFLPMPSGYYKFNDDGKEACIVLSKLKLLRVLSFCCFRGLDALPDSIGELIHLRYLDLSATSIMALPESLGNLYNLQTLKLSGCKKLNVLPCSMQNLVNLIYLDLSWTSIMALPESLGNLYNLQTLKLSYCHKLNVLPSSMQNLVNLLHLDISGAALEEMPKGMGKLTQLQHLSYYIVGKHEENGIKELGGLSNLHGSLSIKKLENVSNGSEALEAKIADKKYISKLWLTWSSADNCFDSQTEMDILCKLQPHQDLQLLVIYGYRGTRFPDWVGNSSYHNMTDITLSSCKNCFMLPSLGQLPSLKNLSISCLDALVTIDAGFYKNNDSSLLTPFPFLESLEFEHMPCWEVWSPTEPYAFPKLRILKIKYCPKLRSGLPSHLPLLESLEFENMPCWEVWCSTEPDAFPKLKRLKIENCPKLRRGLPSHLPALEQLTIIRCTEFASSLPRASAIHSLKIVESNKVALQELPHSIKTLDIEGSPMDCSYMTGVIHKSLVLLHIVNSCDSLTSLPLETFPNLKDLRIDSCENLESLSASQECALQNLSSLSIKKCPNFVSFPREGLHAPSLTHFTVSNCDKLKSLPQQMNTLLPKLDYLRIENCPEIESFPEGGMPPSLRSISIANCEKLLSGPAWPSMDMLISATIEGPCGGIKSFPKEGLLPSSLTSLELFNFSSLETLDCKGLLHLTSLQELTIAYCPKLENIAGERLPASLTKLLIIECPLLNELHLRACDGITVCDIGGPFDGIKSFPREDSLPSSLTSLRLVGFSSLETLDCKGLLHLTSLQELTIHQCPKLENITGERLPASLTHFHISACPLLNELHRRVFDGIRVCYIYGPCDGIKSFPKEGLLPSSLTYLELFNFSSLETLDCKGLLHLTSLQELRIVRCPKLENIAGERLPASLTKLSISACPLLEERLLKHPQVWPKISHLNDIRG